MHPPFTNLPAREEDSPQSQDPSTGEDAALPDVSISIEDLLLEQGAPPREEAPSPCKLPMGEMLLAQGIITQKQLEEALFYQRRTQGRVGWILLTLGYIHRLQLFKAMADQAGLSFTSNMEGLLIKIDLLLLPLVQYDEVIQYQSLPYYLENTGLVILTAYPGNERTLSFFKKRFHVEEIREIVITDTDLTKVTEMLHRERLLENSTYGLLRTKPEKSAYSVFTRRQLFFAGLFSLVVLAWGYWGIFSLILSVNLFVQIFFTVIVAFKLIVSLAGVKSEIEEPVTDQEVQALKEDSLPVYTVLVPVYKEEKVIGLLVDALKKLDYPQNKLDIILLLEEDDKETLEAAKKKAPPGTWRFLVVPHSPPWTKPKACNYGLSFARGKYLVIYDAEDIPDPDQLKRAVIAFQKGSPDHICYQGALNYFNKNENLLTRLFTLEYSYWFDYLLPGLDRLRLVIPLGGTSNHFDTSKLKRIGGWDPFNTTEDADLGVRAYQEGYRVGVVNATTFEEANSKLKNFIRQRSRWIKGYMQTWLVYSRHPIQMIRSLGWKGWISMNLFIGGTPFAALVNPLTWLLFFVWVVTETKEFDPIFPPEILYLSMFNFLFGNFLGIYLNMVSVFKRKYYTLLPFAYLFPFYAALQSIAAYKALWQLFSNPFYWEKTEHGLTKQKKEQA